MKTMLYYVLLFALASCGGEVSQGPEVTNPLSGSEAEARFGDTYRAIQSCTGMKGQNIESLKIEITEDQIDCPYYGGKCAGLFSSPNKIFVDEQGNDPPGKIFAHETIHYLLWLIKDDADTDHQGPLWDQCDPLRLPAK